MGLPGEGWLILARSVRLLGLIGGIRLSRLMEGGFDFLRDEFDLLGG